MGQRGSVHAHVAAYAAASARAHWTQHRKSDRKSDAARTGGGRPLGQTKAFTFEEVLHQIPNMAADVSTRRRTEEPEDASTVG